MFIIAHAVAILIFPCCSAFRTSLPTSLGRWAIEESGCSKEGWQPSHQHTTESLQLRRPPETSPQWAPGPHSAPAHPIRQPQGPDEGSGLGLDGWVWRVCGDQLQPDSSIHPLLLLVRGGGGTYGAPGPHSAPAHPIRQPQGPDAGSGLGLDGWVWRAGGDQFQPLFSPSGMHQRSQARSAALIA